MSAEATVVRNYLDWMLSIPWGVKSRVKTDMPRDCPPATSSGMNV